MALVDSTPRQVDLTGNASLAEAIAAALQAEALVDPSKIACSEGSCGACCVRVDGERLLSCLAPAWRHFGARIETAASWRATDLPMRLAQAGAVQCGFCTPGLVVALGDLADHGVKPKTEAELADLLQAHLCRCTGYQQLLHAGLAWLNEQENS